MPREALLARTLVELADTLVADFDIVELLTLLTDRCLDVLDVAQAFADIATIAILQHQAAEQAQTLNDQLNQALDSRVVVEQAKGMVGERLDLDMPQAFAVLRAHARNHNLRLADRAREVIAGLVPASGLDRLPPPGPDRSAG